MTNVRRPARLPSPPAHRRAQSTPLPRFSRRSIFRPNHPTESVLSLIQDERVCPSATSFSIFFQRKPTRIKYVRYRSAIRARVGISRSPFWRFVNTVGEEKSTVRGTANRRQLFSLWFRLAISSYVANTKRRLVTDTSNRSRAFCTG